MEEAWKQISSRQAYVSPYVSVDEDEILQPDGSRATYYVAHMRNGIGVVAYDWSKVLLVSQYRYPIKKRIWSFVAGGLEHKDNPLLDAQRELKEEAGYTASSWTALGEFPLTPSLSDQKSYVFVAEGLTAGDYNREAGEQDMEAKFFTLEEVDELIMRGEFSAFDITDFYLFKKYLEKNK